VTAYEKLNPIRELLRRILEDKNMQRDKSIVELCSRASAEYLLLLSENERLVDIIKKNR